ncbi:hypothetical protein [Niabella hirudinis]|uniref:hypothetical protein n=1 Tax=Niabella hirudinis TaxID=1285929 RepID=UPI003EC10B67
MKQLRITVLHSFALLAVKSVTARSAKVSQPSLRCLTADALLAVCIAAAMGRAKVLVDADAASKAGIQYKNDQ